MIQKSLVFNIEDVFLKKIPPVEQHVHTDYTDGINSPVEIIEKALALGCERIVFTEHVQRRSKWIFKFKEAIKLLRNQYSGKIEIYLGIESKLIDMDGQIDCLPEYLKDIDLIIGSVHGFPRRFNDFIKFENISLKEAIKLELECSFALINNDNKINVLGHPLGVTIRNYDCELDGICFDVIARQLSKYGIAFDINYKYHAKYLGTILESCRNYGTQVNIGSDAHNLNEIGICYNMIIKYVDSINN